MRSRLLRIGLSLIAIILFLTQSAAQDKEKPAPPKQKAVVGEDDDYRRFFKRPTNTPEYWNAMQFEIDVGKYDLAAVHLRNLLNFKPADADLVKLADELGFAAFLKLRNVHRWSDDAKINKEALANVEVVIKEWIETAKELGRPVPAPKGRLVFA